MNLRQVAENEVVIGLKVLINHPASRFHKSKVTIVSTLDYLEVRFLDGEVVPVLLTYLAHDPDLEVTPKSFSKVQKDKLNQLINNLNNISNDTSNS